MDFIARALLHWEALLSGGGGNPSRVIVRAIGPSLTDTGVADALQDPVLELHDAQGASITTNDNSRDDNSVEIVETTVPPTDDRESAIVATLYPANYTAIVRGKNDTFIICLKRRGKVLFRNPPRAGTARDKAEAR